MKQLVSISLLEFFKIVKKKEFLAGVVLLVFMGCGMMYVAYTSPQSFGVRNVNAFFGNFASILILYFASKSLGEEFDLKTVTFVFTSRSNRTKIFTAKIISIIAACALVGLFGGVLYDVAIVVCKQEWEITNLFWVLAKEILAYALYGFVAGASAILITTIKNTTIQSFIYLILLYWVIPSVLGMVVLKFEQLKRAVDYVVFYFADDFLMYQTWNVKNIIVLMMSGLLLYGLSLVAISKKDI